MRSATAHKIFESDPRFEVDSAGTDKSASTVLEPEQLEWADRVLVMEKSHRNFIKHKYPKYYDKKKIVCLYIPDDFDFMQTELIDILKDKVADVYKRGLLGFPKLRVQIPACPCCIFKYLPALGFLIVDDNEDVVFSQFIIMTNGFVLHCTPQRT
jgi:predicted protein tyrosine phosphatase